MSGPSKRPAGRAGTSPSGPAGIRPWDRTIWRGACGCEACGDIFPGGCQCTAAGRTCACCRAGVHNTGECL